MQYLFLANIALVAFFVFYYFLLRKETFFQVNRAYLLGTTVLSFIIPLFPMEWINDHYSQTFITEARFTLDEALVGSLAQDVWARDDFWSKLTIWEYVYVLGMIIHFLWLCYRFYHLRHSLKRPILSGQAFSFFKQIRIDKDQHGIAYIEAHEKAHATQFHSLDIMLMECLHVFNWFNPFFYLIKREIKLNHEYIADEIVCHNHKQKVHYAEMLLHQSFMGMNNNLINHFKQKNLMKSRIKMLFQHRSTKHSAYKYALVLPITLCLALFTSARMPSRIEQILDAGIEENGGSDEKDFLKLVGSNFNYAQQARARETMGYVDIAFTKSASTITELRLLNDPGDGLGEVGMRLLSKKEVASSAPEGKHLLRIKVTLVPDPKRATSKDAFAIPVPNLSGYKVLNEVTVVGYASATNSVAAHRRDTIPASTGSNSQGEVDYKDIEIQPMPPGGSLRSFFQFIGANYKYPEEAKKAGVKGSVIVQFVIEKDGTLSNLKVLRDLKYGTGQEALRVLQLGGEWKPGLHKGKPVRVSYSLPIRLNLEKAKEENKLETAVIGK
ncbi:M56 family metallopeptidase [Olivibacter sitiensis]|uniref:M56 family metallopeptidase n=1 Tax=Olivibacter sitiensis TaxID=376470 RepID=UPI00042892AE|nr:M56 family metallopeptidase [Olivibacter sitiensis]